MNKLLDTVLLFLLAMAVLPLTTGFGGLEVRLMGASSSIRKTRRSRSSSRTSSTAWQWQGCPPPSSLYSDVTDAMEEEELVVLVDVEDARRREEVKRSIVQMGASYDRGFGASRTAKEKMARLLVELEGLNLETDASRFVDGPQIEATKIQIQEEDVQSDGGDDLSNNKALTSPLTGSWRMIWTTAQDVLILGANPLVTVGAIYQIFDLPIVTNVIDLLPSFQNLLLSNVVPGSLLRAEVQTRASSRPSKPMRVGLDFEKVSLNPKELLGQDVSSVLPPFGFNLPKVDVSSLQQIVQQEDVGYFDVTFLDSELLVIRQNAPGGCFVLVKVEDTEP